MKKININVGDLWFEKDLDEEDVQIEIESPRQYKSEPIWLGNIEEAVNKFTEHIRQNGISYKVANPYGEKGYFIMPREDYHRHYSFYNPVGDYEKKKKPICKL